MDKSILSGLRRSIKGGKNHAACLMVLLTLCQEIWNSPYSNDSFPVYAEDIDEGSSPSTAMLSEAAKALKVTIVGSSIPERCGDRLYNACCVFGSIGVLKAKHRKTLDVLV
ncbi:omega-amidase, chloroplastic-like [Syzygium oleosum]|uniref:omega-amidase, chloroplastic-like n=1 Tax=Syzygium oleosum TaxID=219896 RepID=UPI0024BABCEE|nr:omega-amidase, chloroplastic-like [Syzygium oleosum]